MNDYALDASAVLAVLQNEPGKDRVDAILDRSVMGRVNVTEVLTSLINKGLSLEEAIIAFESMGLMVIEFDKAQSERISFLRPITKHLGLSLGDRACLALAIQENAIAVTADRNWSELDVCKIEIIR